MNNIVKKISAVTAGVFFLGVCYAIEFTVALCIAVLLNGSMIYGKPRMIIAAIVFLVDVVIVILMKDEKKEEVK